MSLVTELVELKNCFNSDGGDYRASDLKAKLSASKCFEMHGYCTENFGFHKLPYFVQDSSAERSIAASGPRTGLIIEHVFDVFKTSVNWCYNKIKLIYKVFGAFSDPLYNS